VIGETDGSTNSKQTRVVAAAGLARANIFNELDCQTAFHGDFDQQRLSGALANPTRADEFCRRCLTGVDSATGVAVL
jgi:hypothetical protein